MKMIRLIFPFSLCAFLLTGANIPDSIVVQPDTIMDRNGKPLIMFPFSLKWENSGDAKLNLSFTLEKPAGKDGFISIQDGHFVKPTGERFRIWGVNLTANACFPDKKDAPLVAAYLARFGINAVRLHFLDSNWGQGSSLFNYSLNTTRELYAAQLDKLDYFIAELKKAGIYTDLNLNVGRTYREGDSVPEYQYLGFAKAVTLFDDHIIDLQKEYARQLLTHVNPYTGNAYKDEAAVIIVEIVNENSLVEAWFDNRLLGLKSTNESTTWMDIPPYYGRQLTMKYNNWLKQNLDSIALDKLEMEAGVAKGEEIPRLTPKEFADASKFRFHTEAEFIMSTERDFYTGMYDCLKNEIGVKSLIVANSDHNHWRSGYALLSNLSLLDVVDGHVYWQHPSARTDEKTGRQYTIIANTPMVDDPGFSTVVQLSRSAVEGKPYIVSETNHPFPAEYACEGIPILGAYASLQDWDGIFYYTLEHVAPDRWYTYYSGSFGMGMDPVKMAGMAATGLMFLRGDLKPAGTCIYRGYSRDDLKEGIRMSPDKRPLYTDGFSPFIPLIFKTRIRSFDDKTESYPIIEEQPIIKAQTGEIRWHKNENSFVEVSAPDIESFSGYTIVYPTLLKHLNINIDNEFASITLISLEDKPLDSAEKLLLVTTGRAGVKGMQWDKERQRLIKQGAKPTTIEVIRGEVTIKKLKGAKSVTIEPLDGSGNPIRNFSKKVKRKSVTFSIGDDVTVWYYLTVRR